MGVVWTFLLLSILSPLSPSLWETARYRPKYCLKSWLKPKTTNQPNLLVTYIESLHKNNQTEPWSALCSFYMTSETDVNATVAIQVLPLIEIVHFPVKFNFANDFNSAFFLKSTTDLSGWVKSFQLLKCFDALPESSEKIIQSISNYNMLV